MVEWINKILRIFKIINFFSGTKDAPEENKNNNKTEVKMADLPVKKGDRSTKVSEVQKLLGLLGYDIMPDGIFGGATDAAVRDFQKEHSLTVDGIVGNNTYDKLKDEADEHEEDDDYTLNSEDGIDIITDYKLDDSQYIKNVTDKTQIFIHFTAGNPKAKNVIRYWDSNEARIATAYVIDRNTGDVYECFNPNYWGFHLGIKNTNGRLDKASVGIEICAWGPLKEKDGEYLTYVNTKVPEEDVYKLDEPFRGYKYFEAYTDEQIENVEKLLKVLIEKYNIKVQDSFDESWFEYNQDVIDKTLPGIWTHTNVRKDKSDSYPDKRLLDMLNRIANEFNG